MRVRWKENLPPIVQELCRRMQQRPPPLLLGRYARRSELVEAVQAIGPIMASRTDVRSGRIGKPDKTDRRKWVGLAVDHDLAPLSGISESRSERTIGTFKDWGWLHFQVIKPGRRQAKRGFLRCSSQPIERMPNGDRRGRAAIRVWTDEVWRYYGLTPALAEARLKLSQAAQKQAAAMTVTVRPLVAQLVDALWDPTSTPRPPP